MAVLNTRSDDVAAPPPTAAPPPAPPAAANPVALSPIALSPIAVSPIAVSVGMAWWKRAATARALTALGHAGRFSGDVEAAVETARRASGAVATWAAREPPRLAAAAAAAGVAVVRVEDGFLRSVGLGADFTPAASLILDRTGVYYDPSGPSDLETALQSAPMPPALLARARALRTEIVRRGVTKYAADPGAGAPAFDRPAGRRVVFVPGQVEDDRSVQRGGAGVAGNLDLLRRVRGREPDAFVVYKPHPDVEAGHRRGATPDAAVLALADRIVRDTPTPALLAAADAVHTLTSLCGFEALLRGVPVTTHGQPFYAGWGLTTDLAPQPHRRTRRLTVDMLTAGALILAPVYLDPVTGAPCTPETLLDRLADPSLWRPGALVRLRRIEGRLVCALRSLRR